MRFNLFGLTITNEPTAAIEPAPPASSNLVARSARKLAVTDDPTSAGSGLGAGGNSPIETLVRRISNNSVDLTTELHLRHVIRGNVSDFMTALLYRRAFEGDLCIKSDDETLAEELAAWWSEIPVGTIEGTGSLTGGDLYLDMLADGADEYGLQIGEKMFRRRRLDRLFLPDMRTFNLKKNQSGFGSRLIQNQDGREVEITGGTIHSLAFKGSSSHAWPSSLIDGAVLPAEALLRMIISINTIWMKAGDPPMRYGIEYEKDAAVPVKSFTLPNGDIVQGDQNLEDLHAAIVQVQQARRRGMSAHMVLSIVGGKVIAEPVFGNPTTAGLVKEAEPHFRIASGLISQLSELPDWLFASGTNKSEGLGSNRANAQAAIAFEAAARRRRRLEPIARDILNAHILAEGSTSSVGNFYFEWTTPSVINEEIIQKTRQAEAGADAGFVRTSFELFNPEGAEITEEQRVYLERRGVLEAAD